MNQSNKTFPNENNLDDITGFIRTLTEEPSYIPRSFSEQYVLVTTGGSSRAYLYDISSNTWKSVVIS